MGVAILGSESLKRYLLSQFTLSMTWDTIILDIFQLGQDVVLQWVELLPD